MAICLEHTMLTYLNNAHMLYLENYKSDPKNGLHIRAQRPQKWEYTLVSKKTETLFYCALRYIVYVRKVKISSLKRYIGQKEKIILI